MWHRADIQAPIPVLSRPDVFHCLGMWCIWMGGRCNPNAVWDSAEELEATF